MASKGQKFNSYSPELKKEILDKYYKGIGGCAYLSIEYGIPLKTLKNWITKNNHGKNVIIDNRQTNSGRPKNPTTIEDYKEQCEILKKYQAFIETRRGKR